MRDVGLQPLTLVSTDRLPCPEEVSACCAGSSSSHSRVLVAVCATARPSNRRRPAIVGLVTDSTQAAVPGATVTATNVGHRRAARGRDRREGRYSIPALRPRPIASGSS